MASVGEEDWNFEDDESHEYAYEDYSTDKNNGRGRGKGNKKKKREREEAEEDEEDTRSSTSSNETGKKETKEGTPHGNSSGLERAAPWIPDAFCGHHCPICLGAIQDSAMVESCRHLYCRSCLFEWLAISDRCPLCKVEVSRVLHNIKSPKEYKLRLHVKVNSGGGGRSLSPGVSSPSELPGTLTEVSLRGEGKTSGRGGGGGGARGAEFRSMVYRRDLAAEPPETKARRPKSEAQLRPWIAREVQAAAAGRRSGTGGRVEGDTRLVAEVMEALMKDNDLDDQEGYCTVKEQLQGFLFENTGPFLHELWCFRWSKAGMSAYDRDALYSPRRPRGR